MPYCCCCEISQKPGFDEANSGEVLGGLFDCIKKPPRQSISPSSVSGQIEIAEFESLVTLINQHLILGKQLKLHG